MANVNSPQGFTLFHEGGTLAATRRRRRVAADRAGSTVLCIGDAYTLLSDGTVERASASDTIRGVIEAIEMQERGNGVFTESMDYIPDDVAGYIIGIEDKNAILSVQSDVTGATEANVDGSECDLVDGAGSTTLRRSRQYVTVGAGEFTLVGLDPTIGNESGAYARVLVRMKNCL